MPANSNTILSTATCDLVVGGAPLTLRVSRRARRMTLRLDRRGEGLVLTVPPGSSRRRALAWAAAQEEWVMRSVAATPARTVLAAGASVPLFGRPHRIEWSAERPRRIARVDDAILCGGPAEGLEARLMRWLLKEAHVTLEAETRFYAEKLGKPAGRVSIGDPRSRWGSCSARGDIRYSWRLILMPDSVRRATVAHEVAHLEHMNHGPDFHALVARLYGEDPGRARAWLRREGAGLHRIG